MIALINRLMRSGIHLMVLAVVSAGSVFAQDSVEFTDVSEVAATVTALEPDQRLVTLRGSQGDTLTIEAGPEVRNFAQIEVGDTVRLVYQLTYGATRVDPDQVPDVAPAATAALVRTVEGARPGAAIGIVDSIIVVIESVGPDGRTATFVNPEGNLQAIFVRRDEGRAFARSLVPGDLVKLTAAQAVAVAVEHLGE